ncbi:MAG: hypothetical protein DRN25_07150 [Thermoplasmata archaeon]|nr:MAG: hypothetical protein DRN25_07150 [Thermoplasmata archaeon]
MSNILLTFLENLYDYLIEVAPALILGFIISGFIHEFVPNDLISRYLTGKGVKPIVYTTLVGIFLPVCCIGSLPVAVTLHRRGVSLGPVLAFLVATPATSITALLVTYSLLGLTTMIYLFISVAMIAILLGILAGKMRIEKISSDLVRDPVCGMEIKKEKSIRIDEHENFYFCSEKCAQEFLEKEKRTVYEKVRGSLRFSISLVKEMWLEISLGLIIAAIISSVDALSRLIETYLYGVFAYMFSVIFGIIMYICSTGSVPLVHALISQGFAPGAGLVMLILGPVTSYSTLLVIRKEFGIKTLSVYLAIIIITSLIFGYGYSLII